MDIIINIGMFLTYILAFCALVSILFFAVFYIVKNLKQAKSSIVGIGVLLLVFILAYFISPADDVPLAFFEKTLANPDMSKLIGSGLISLYIFLFGIIAVIIYTQIFKLIKK